MKTSEGAVETAKACNPVADNDVWFNSPNKQRNPQNASERFYEESWSSLRDVSQQREIA
jgi:hypothetical protein